jgi:hypothetical protein
MLFDRGIKSPQCSHGHPRFFLPFQCMGRFRHFIPHCAFRVWTRLVIFDLF